MRFLELGKRNFREIWREPLYLVFLLGLPIVLMLLIGWVYGGQSPGANPVGIVNQDNSSLSQTFEEVLKNVPSLDIRHYPDPAQAGDNLKFGDIKAFITIPQGFGQQVEKNRQGIKQDIILNVSYDQSDPVLAEQLIATVREALTEFSGTKPPITLDEETIQPKSGFLNWLAPGIIVFGLLMLISISGSNMVMDKERGFLSRLLTTPIKPSGFVMGYALPFCLIGVIQILFFIAFGLLIGVKIHGNVALAFLILLLAGLCCVGAGIIVGSLAKTKGRADALGWFLILPLIFLAGCWTPMDVMPLYFQKVAYALPFAHATDAARDIVSKGVGFSVIATDFYWLIGWTAVLFAAGITLFRKRMVS